MSKPIIDCQVHAYEHNHPERPWQGHLTGPDSANGAEMCAAMDAVNVDGAILVSPFSMYRFDPSYALEVQVAFPHRFGLVRPFDPTSASVEDEVAEWAQQPGVIGARLMLSGIADTPASSEGGIDRLFAACAHTGLPLNVLAWGSLTRLGDLARRHPNTQVVLDHLGLPQPFSPPPPAKPFAALADVCALAACDNLAIKISGACTLSHEAFPFADIWQPLTTIFDAFGLTRCLWGTDWTRAVKLVTYQEGVDAFRDTGHLSASDKEQLMGGTLASIYNWSPAPV
jgi:L-fuconolactonase